MQVMFQFDGSGNFDTAHEDDGEPGVVAGSLGPEEECSEEDFGGSELHLNVSCDGCCAGPPLIVTAKVRAL